ncbi:hypothetical protein E1A91_D02G193600v1 [Gossypium mustelinum]|uniref:Uncharacterized protein n=1 Tax=Gossypium mustelinum TaxID=34275 RepID=A0A5D2VXZ3_GOSMU|nr:hypothetical protein E1A91_D02G193600v1 [Gossypium mustelinum]
MWRWWQWRWWSMADWRCQCGARPYAGLGQSCHARRTKL